MEYCLLTIGKTSTEWVREGIEQYSGRLRRYVKFALKELPDVKNARSLTATQQKAAEGKLLISEFSDSDIIVLLDERGREYTSVEFSAWLDRLAAGGRKRVLFVVGGPYGFSEEVYARAMYKVSLSKMTFNHEMVRLFFTEQIYRAMTIQRGEPYHHE